MAASYHRPGSLTLVLGYGGEIDSAKHQVMPIGLLWGEGRILKIQRATAHARYSLEDGLCALVEGRPYSISPEGLFGGACYRVDGGWSFSADMALDPASRLRALSVDVALGFDPIRLDC